MIIRVGVEYSITIHFQLAYGLNDILESDN